MEEQKNASLSQIKKIDLLQKEFIGHNRELILWVGKPSQMINLSLYVFSICLIIAIYYTFERYGDKRILYAISIPLLFCLASFLRTFCTVFILSNERLIKRYGIFNKYVLDIELYRVKDVFLIEPFLFRFFNLGNIRLLTSQKSFEKIFLPGIKYPSSIRNKLRDLMEERRVRRGVKEFDTN